MLNEAILILGVIACIAGLSVAIWSFATSERRHQKHVSYEDNRGD